jgi:hypothetical protein
MIIKRLILFFTLLTSLTSLSISQDSQPDYELIKDTITSAVQTAKVRYILINPNTDPKREATFEEIIPYLSYDGEYFVDGQPIEVLEKKANSKILSLGTYGNEDIPMTPIVWED